MSILTVKKTDEPKLDYKRIAREEALTTAKAFFFIPYIFAAAIGGIVSWIAAATITKD